MKEIGLRQVSRLAFECEEALLYMRLDLRRTLARICAISSFAAVILAANAGVIAHASPAPKPMPAQMSYAGARVTFVGNQVRLTSNGMTLTVATDSARRLNPMFALLASVSPDGATLLYVTGDTESMRNATITTVNLRTLTKRVIAKLGNTFWIHKPLWSPDSSQILYINQNATTFAPEVWVMTATGAHRRLVVSGGALTHRSLEGFERLAPRWSADGKSILFYDSAFKPTAGWLVSLATGARMPEPSPNICVFMSQTIGKNSSLPRLCGSGGGICYVPVYYQNNQTWSNNIMYGKINGSVVSASIGSQGCALTSLTMLFDYNGSTVGNPGGMNNCMSPWYYAYPLNWVGAQVNPPNGPGCDKYTTNWIQQVGFSWSTLDSYLRSGWPVILGGCWDAPTCNNTHWVVVTGGDGSDVPAGYLVNDPWQGEATTLSGLTTHGFTPEWMSLYQKASGTGSPCE